MNQEAYILFYEKNKNTSQRDEALGGNTWESIFQSFKANLNWLTIGGNHSQERKFTLKGGTKENSENDDQNKTAEVDVKRKPAVKRTHSEDSDSSEGDSRL